LSEARAGAPKIPAAAVKDQTCDPLAFNAPPHPLDAPAKILPSDDASGADVDPPATGYVQSSDPVEELYAEIPAGLPAYMAPDALRNGVDDDAFVAPPPLPYDHI